MGEDGATSVINEHTFGEKKYKTNKNKSRLEPWRWTFLFPALGALLSLHATATPLPCSSIDVCLFRGPRIDDSFGNATLSGGRNNVLCFSSLLEMILGNDCGLMIAGWKGKREGKGERQKGGLGEEMPLPRLASLGKAKDWSTSLGVCGSLGQNESFCAEL